MATGNIDQRDPDEIVDDLDLEDEDDDDDEDDDEDPGEASMTLVEHLEELRWRIFKSAIAIVVFGIVAFIFREQIQQFLTYPLPKSADALGGKPIITGVGEGFTVFLKISFAVGFILALPVILYQVWAFISPGLLAREKKHAVPFIVIGIFLFVAGIALGYVVLRFPVEWLINFSSQSFTPLISADSYY